MMERSFTEKLETWCDFLEFVVILMGIDFLVCLTCCICWRFVVLCGQAVQIFLCLLGVWNNHATHSVAQHSKTDKEDISLASMYLQSSSVNRKGKLFLKSFCSSKVLVSILFAMIPRPEIKQIVVSNETSALYDNTTGYFHVMDKLDVALVQNPGHGCTDATRYILMVLSSPTNIAQREHLRRKYRGQDDIFMLFLLGTPSSAQIQLELKNENLVNGDLLQGSVQESYRALSYKTHLGFIWTGLNCPQAKFTVKIDDNVDVNLEHIMHTLDQKYGKDTQFHDTPPPILECPAPVKNMRPWRHGHTNTVLGKWAVTIHEMPRRLFPDFCFGWLYVTTPKVGLELAEVARYDQENIKISWRDDQYITGFLRERLPHVKIQQIQSGWTDALPCPYVGITANVFFNDFVLQKSSGQVAYVGGVKFYWCIFFEFFILEKFERLFPVSIPNEIWDTCSR